MRLGRYVRLEKRVWLSAILSSGILVFAVTDNAVAQIGSVTTITSPTSHSTMQLQNAAHRLNAWLLGSGQNQRWRRDLMLNVLEAQSARGEQADIGMLNQVYSRFCSGAPELEQPAFRDVRNALQSQMHNLSQSRAGDLYAALTMARGKYRQISAEELAVQRDQAKNSLQALKGYWRETMHSKERAELFFELQLDEAIKHLDEVNFELAPEISVGKMTSMIRGVNAELLEVVRAIDALPFESEANDDGEQEAENQDDKPQDSENANQQPQPDDSEPTRDDLEKQRKKLEARIAELKQQRADVLKLDKPRQTARASSFNQLRKYEANFATVGEKMGDPYFVSAAMAYERFMLSFFYGTSDNLQEEFLKKLELLESDLLQIDGPDARIFAGKVGDHLRWMENTNQIPHIVTAIRAKYSLPNMFVSISGGLLNQIGAQSVSESKCLNENIDGRLVRGTLYTNANVAIELQNDPNQVHASIHLTGSMSTQTYIDQGKIRAFANTSGQLEGRRSIYANIGGLYANAPIVAANIQAIFKGTSSQFRFVDRIATKKFNEVKRKTESGAARRAEDELIEKFQKQTDEAVGKGMGEIMEAQKKIIVRTNVLPEVYIRSFYSEIMAIGKKSSISSLAAQTKPANFAMPADVLVRVHDSMPTNFLDKIFSGKTFSNEELAEEFGSISGESPETLQDKPGAGKDESFSITFANIRPIQIEFENNGFRVVVSGRRFAQGDKKINEGLKIILRFKVMRVDGKLKLVRDGEAEIDYLPDAPKRPATVAFRSFLIGKLNPQDDVEELELELPDNLIPIDEVEALQDSKVAKAMLLTQCRAENGWLYLGWKYQEGVTYSNLIYDIPAIWSENANSQPPSVLIENQTSSTTPQQFPVVVAQPY